MVAAYQQTYSKSWLTRSEHWRTRCSVCIHQMNRMNFCNGLAMMTMTAPQTPSWLLY